MSKEKNEINGIVKVENNLKSNDLQKLENNLKNIQNEISKSIKEFEWNINSKETNLRGIQTKILESFKEFELKIDKKDTNINSKLNELKEILNTVEEFNLAKKDAIDLELKQYKNIQTLAIDNELLKYKLDKKEPIDNELILEINQKFEELKKFENNIRNLEMELNSKDTELKFKEKSLNKKEINLDKILEEKSEEQIQDLNEKLIQKDNIISKKNEIIISLDKEIRELREVETEYGDLDSLKRKIEEKESMIKNLKNKVSEMVSKEMLDDLEEKIKDYEEVKNKYSKLLNQNLENEKFNDKITEYKIKEKELENRNSILETDIQTLSMKNSHLESKMGEINDQINRLKNLNSSDKEISREKRIEEIKERSTLENIDKLKLSEKIVDEIKWIDNIKQKSESCGLYFDDRILYSFHTALKIADYSIITVLAGVSGTGKSELPRYYSTFGGLNYINIAVKPNWDSQESMLGYFNAIDNRFDPEPLLSFLLDVTDINNTRSNVMSLILLDEMNLAHVEYYFAEFLSKLETRRGVDKSNLPCIEVKLGTGIKSYELPLLRTLLWTGTMNQDETTKSLSDKVLDRGVVINFPRPTEFYSRNKTLNISEAIKIEKENGTFKYLRKEAWAKWISREIKGELVPIIEKYKKITERINNEALSKVGRALGHRVWQAIAYYIANHPLVNKFNYTETLGELKYNSNLAYIDQIVQKIVPKLRGIETNGVGKECLDKIIEILTDNDLYEDLKEDFELAMKIGYGQFIWSSSTYIKKGEFIKEKNVGELNE